MVLSILVNAALDVTFGVGWWVVKKVGSSIYDLGSNLFFEKAVRPSLAHIVDLKDIAKEEKEKEKEDEHKRMEQLIELLEHDLVAIKHNQEIILHRLEVEDDDDEIEDDDDDEEIIFDKSFYN